MSRVRPLARAADKYIRNFETCLGNFSWPLRRDIEAVASSYQFREMWNRQYYKCDEIAGQQHRNERRRFHEYTG